ncbi:MAG TPA: regulatory iron-sulfur-containing complex subunit RicT [Bacteroidales bacterium]|nr:regulatory iron-sulfur-containing complex subunit RicT [Bacteroidales bacterium]
MDNEENKIAEKESNNITEEYSYRPNDYKLNSVNWLSDIPDTGNETDIVEIRFKNTRKAFFRNVNKLRLKEGDVVAVEASPGHDIGRVSMTGRLALIKMKQLKVVPSPEDIKKIYRKAKTVDLEKWEDARKQEIPTMLRARILAKELKLNMKIGDVEYQGDKTKAIFYYIADERVDFRQLIKVLAENFRIRIEMRQIGARQEAGRIGGVGSCGRELCCSSYLTNFVSVTTAYARCQELSLNPQKLAGQCGKLKCCLNFELDSYVDRQKNFPPKETLETEEGKAYFSKIEIFKDLYWYSFDRDNLSNPVAVPVSRVKEVLQMNRKGKKPVKLIDHGYENIDADTFTDVVGSESLTRFDKKKKNKKNKKKNIRKRKGKRPDKNDRK